MSWGTIRGQVEAMLAEKAQALHLLTPYYQQRFEANYSKHSEALAVFREKLDALLRERPLPGLDQPPLRQIAEEAFEGYFRAFCEKSALGESYARQFPGTEPNIGYCLGSSKVDLTTTTLKRQVENALASSDSASARHARDQAVVKTMSHIIIASLSAGIRTLRDEKGAYLSLNDVLHVDPKVQQLPKTTTPTQVLSYIDSQLHEGLSRWSAPEELAALDIPARQPETAKEGFVERINQPAASIAALG